MRKVIYGAATSLDLFIARKDDGVDWLRWSGDVSEIASAFLPTVDAVLMGRRTYEMVKPSSETGYEGMAAYVFSRTLPPRVEGAVEIVSGDAASFVRDLKQRPGKGIYLMSGAELARPLLEAGLIDEIGVNVHPVLLGEGIPFLHPVSRQVDLELMTCRPLKHGCVYLSYRVRN